MADELNPAGAPEANPVQEIKDGALAQMAKSEDISAYAAERQDRDAETEPKAAA